MSAAVASPADRSARTGVLIVGGGLVGLSAGLFLQYLGVPFVLVERSVEASPLPRSRGIHVRTMELFRQVGLQQAVEAAAKAAWEQGGFGGARRGRSMLESDALPTQQIAHVAQQDPSPCSFCACPQTLLEPVLRRPLEERGGDVRFGCELLSWRETDDGVEATLRTGGDAAGQTSTISAAYVLAADGGRSFVRAQLGIATVDTVAQQHLLNVFFRADLAERVRGRTFSQCEIANGRVRGLFLSKNNTTEWSFHLDLDPGTSSPGKLSDAELVPLVQAAIGADVPVEILAKAAWSTGVRIAERYRAGRIFLAGDAAHVMPPWGGFNGSTGIADAHNLAWKLAAAIGGGASADLLDSYEAERRPVAVRNGRQALLRTDFDARFALRTERNREAMAHMLDTGALLTRHRYAAASEPVDALRGQTGTRFPHAWITRGEARLSTLDLFGEEHVLLVGPQGATRWRSPSRQVVGANFAFADEGGDWTTLTGLPDDGALQVRPDGFVEARSDESLRPAAATGASS